MLIPLVRSELKSRPGAPLEPADVRRILDVLDAWAAGVLAPVGEAHAKGRLDRMMAVADVIRTLVRLVRPEVKAASGG